MSYIIIKMLIIHSWVGRAGNNILQIIRALYYAKINNHHIIKFDNHSLLTSNTIMIELKMNKPNMTEIIDTFFYLKQFNIIDPDPVIMKSLFQKYIRPIFNIVYTHEGNSPDELYIHIRSGDIFTENPHNAYIQPPLIYYTNIIKQYLKIKMVCEDNVNPCVNELLKIENTEYMSNTLEMDLVILSNVFNLVVGFGTFGFLLYLMNPNLKNLYIPKYCIDELPVGDWGENVKVHIIDLPNYIKVGEWKNTVEQREFMVSYCI